jgi:NAD-specific glutamate dehydrogenase
MSIILSEAEFEKLIFSEIVDEKDFKDKFSNKLDVVFKMLYDVNFTNWDFRKFIDTLSFQNDGRNDEAKTFILRPALFGNKR